MNPRRWLKDFAPDSSWAFALIEVSWIPEDNLAVQRLTELFGGKPLKTYRIYQARTLIVHSGQTLGAPASLPANSLPLRLGVQNKVVLFRVVA